MFEVTRRLLWIAIPACAALLLGTIGSSTAQTAFPNGTVQIVQGYAPGGPVDLAARILAAKLQEIWGQSVLVEGRVGASGTIAADAVVRSRPDGRTLLLGASPPLAVAPLLFANVPFDPVKDLTAIRQFADTPLFLVVNPSLPINSFAEFLAYAKAASKPVTIATSGSGGLPHLAAAELAIAAGLNFLYVPYNGVAPAQLAVIGGEANAMFVAPAIAIPAAREGKIRALATTGSSRSSDLPDIPSIAEAGFPGYTATVWLGVFGPAKMPPEIVSKIDRDLQEALKDPQVRTKLQTAGYTVLDVGAEKFSAVIQQDLALWSNVIRTLGIKPQ